ncbi:Phosphoribosylformylglycinamidine synthase II [Moorella glycerini]|uniref:Phosphoribosylformylglycinamidine synthase subunit PurL n=1 Tax=Neomoorella stamsii TaxID=1266720 RepID=A0A9X7J0Y7_9FIRM|nr:MULTISPECIES: phosphoribosylformylglycinamidine synthase subunit PurL [Moorella]PRR68972.1 Phosphoribosylformylglycinamidine synthase 2 [Moorella stamsii]CEP67593.1 Phosphoribosylformylglycinamidine synthase II [Moorella glycerini]
MEPEVYQQMGLTDEEFERIKEILGREPNYVEVGMFAVMWSEHCGYKHSRPVLKLFPTKALWVLQGPGENAGIIDIGDGQAVVFKIESHNHPSAIEPFQGAATGVGGIVRDIFAMGARPVAVLDSLRFGPLDDPRTRYLMGGVVAGIAFYGNCLGLPTVAGEVYFDPSYTGNPLVNVMAVGLIEQKDIRRGRAAGVGNAVMLVGARTGRDGIHGATFASEELSEASEERRPSVQVGDPFREKLLIEACLDIIKEDLIIGMQDMGAAGITSSSCEMAARAGTGMEIDVALVPRREEGMTPYEVMLSESQERMLLVPKKGAEERIQAICRRWGLEAVVIGRVTDDGIMRIKEGDRVVAEVPARALTDQCPVYQVERRRPAYLDKLQEQDLSHLPEPGDYGEVLLKLLAAPNIASKEWVYRQYDYMVRTDTVAGPGGDAAVLRIKGTGKALALTVDGNGRYCYLDPETGGAIAVAEAARNLSCVGARPLGLTDCLNFGNPEKPEVAWQFYQAVVGMSRACEVLQTPVTGGNVSFYNETEGEAIYPTPVVGMVGLIADIEKRCAFAWRREDDVLILLGETYPEIGGSEYLAVIHGLVAGRPPRLNLEREAAVQEVVRQAIAAGLVTAAHDCAEGGLAVALAESALAGGVGAMVELASILRPDYLLFSESQSRVLLAVPPAARDRVLAMAREKGVPATVIGRIVGQTLLVRVNGRTLFNLSLGEMEKQWRESIPALMAR